MSYGIVATTTTEGRKMINKNCTKLVAAMGITLFAGAAQAANIAANGDFETGDFTGWTQEGALSVQSITADNNGGNWAGQMVVGPLPNPYFGGAVEGLLKNANRGAGTIQSGDEVTVSFDYKGFFTGDGGVFFTEIFSELGGGGTSQSLFFNPGSTMTTDWQTFSQTVNVGLGDVSGGVTLLLKAGCGPVPGCGVDVQFDNVSIDYVSAVPVPAAAWLFGSGLLGLVGVARRKSRS
jgi:hypothetical protein